jgi:hypothetical protein
VGIIVSRSGIEPLFDEAAGWDLFDVNVRLGPSGVHGELALDGPALSAEMDRFAIRNAVVSHWTAEEYDAEIGNRALEHDLTPRFTPAWAARADRESMDALEKRRPIAVRLTPGATQHNFSLAPWSAGPLFEYLQACAVVTLIARPDIEWESLVRVLDAFPRLVIVLLDVGYRSDRYLFPLLTKYSGLHFDSATYLAHRQLETFVERHGSERVLFGTRLPLYTPAAALGVLASARVPNQDRLAIAGGNLRRLLAGCRNPAHEVRA